MSVSIIQDVQLMPSPLPFATSHYLTQLYCPICGPGAPGDPAFVHIVGQRVLTARNEDNGSAEFVRGPALRLHFKCETEHHFSLDFGFHKGSTFVRVAPQWAHPDDMFEHCDECVLAHWGSNESGSTR